MRFVMADGEENKRVPWQEHEKLQFKLEQLEKQFQLSSDKIASLNEDKRKLEHLIGQLQSETETIGEYVTLYQVQRGLLQQRAEQLAQERQALRARIDRLTQLLPRLAPQLKQIPQWQKLSDGSAPENLSGAAVTLVADTADQVACSVTGILLEMTSQSLISMSSLGSELDSLLQPRGAPAATFRPFGVEYTGSLMTV